MNSIVTNLLFSILCISLIGCHQESKMENKQVQESLEQAEALQPNVTADAQNWITEFSAMREAIAKGDLNKQKSYFTFPINADTTQIWYAIYDKVEQEQWPSPLPSTFTESDFEQYHQNLFTVDFKTGLSKIDLDSLRKEGHFTTPTINNEKTPYY